MYSTGWRSRAVEPYFALISLLFFALVLIGLWHNYSPVPDWDMWDGYIVFFSQISNGDWKVWFSQHNEHRIIFSRLLFWIDIRYFGGEQKFLMLINLVLLMLMTGMMLLIARELRLRESLSRMTFSALAGTLMVVGLSWIQNVNFVWAFQSQFIAAYLFPFVSFYALYRHANSGRIHWLVLSAMLGVLAAGTMANGLATLFLLTGLAVLYRLSMATVATLLCLGLMTAGLYLGNFHSVPEHGRLLETLDREPLAFALYTLAYLGNPFYYLFFRIDNIEVLFGALLLLATAYSLRNLWTKTDMQPHRNLLLVLFAFITYVICTALVTAGGRAPFGLEQANTSRYTTPTLFAWCALLLIGLRIKTPRSGDANLIIRLLVVLTLLLLPDQLKTLKSKDNKHYDEMVAALALDLGINDPTYISKVYPAGDLLLPRIEEARRLEYSIFGHPLIREAEDLIGDPLPPTPQPEALLYNTALTPLGNQHSRVEGMLCEDKLSATISKALTLSIANTIVGYGLTRKLEEMSPDPCDNGRDRQPYLVVGYILNDLTALSASATHRQLIHFQRWLPHTYWN